VPVKVRDVIRLIEGHGWRFARQQGSHRQYHHPEKPGTVTVSGHPGEDMPERTFSSVLRQAGLSRKDLK
jgi:predicted RNA binding protein YcfA (HicA-like mRNA interferase family)